VVKDNVAFTVESNTQLSLLESQIHTVELRESNALLQRDTATLKILWDRDFTMDMPLDEVVAGNNPIPYYIVCNRRIERIDEIDNIVYCKGIEYVRILKENGTLGEMKNRKFFHSWMKKDGEWKLITKAYE
jgi:hypothetical protein